MSTNAITEYERELITTLKEEYSFYQALFVLLDKQRDLIKFDREDHLLDLYVEVERCQRRIAESEEKIGALRKGNPQYFRIAAAHPEVRKLVNSIATLVRRNLEVVKGNQEIAGEKYERIREELDQLRHSDKLLRYFQADMVPPQFVDDRH